MKETDCILNWLRHYTFKTKRNEQDNLRSQSSPKREGWERYGVMRVVRSLINYSAITGCFPSHTIFAGRYEESRFRIF